MATKAELMALLRDQRDRLADEIDGVNFALQAGCDLPALALLLIPGLGLAVYTTARAACASLSADQLRQRVVVAQGVIDKLQDMGAAVDAADPSQPTWTTVEAAARDLAAAASRVRLLADTFVAAGRFVGEVFDKIRNTPNILQNTGWAVAAAAAAVAVLLLVVKR